MERRLAAILVTDMVGYSRLMGLDEEGTIARQRTHKNEVFDPRVAQHGGRIFKTTGDGMLVEFPSVVDAVKCAMAIQTELNGCDADVSEDRRIRYRIGINLGDIVSDGDDILGDGVNVATRLEGLAEPGGVCISGTVYDHLAGKVDGAFEDAGEQTFKNVPRPVRCWHWRSSQPAVGATNSNCTLPLPDNPSIAVLPFNNISGDSDQEYFADGITDDIITDLSKISGLFVIARNSTFVYKGRAADIKQVARELGVRYVLEGSVRKGGAKVRINAQLIDAATASHLQVIHSGLGFTRFVIDVRTNVGAVGIAWIERKRLVDQLVRAIQLARLAIGERVLAEKPPVVAVVWLQSGRLGEKLRLSPGSPGEADEPEDARAGLCYHHIARVFGHMGADRGIGGLAIAVDQKAKGVQMCGILGAKTFAELSCLGHCRSRTGNVALDLSSAREAAVPEGEARVRKRHRLECFAHVRRGTEELVDGLHI
jgi:TolB-like protein